MRAQSILDELKREDITHVVGIPDNGSRVLYELLWEDPDIEVVMVSRESEAFSLASGLYIGGKHPMVLIQNTGFLESGDGFRGTAFNMGIPLVVLIGYRGRETLNREIPRVDTAALFFEPTLEAWNIPYSIMLSDTDAGQIAEAGRQAAAISRPVAAIFPGILD